MPESVLPRLLPALAVTMILLIVGTWALLWHQHQLARKIAADISDVGNLLIIHDITADKAAYTRMMLLGGITGTFLLALIFGLIYILLRRTDAGIRVQQAALRASELRYRRLFESAKDGILILDAETGMVVDVNPFLIQLLGISREAFLGKAIWQLGFFKDIVANQDSFTELQQQKYIRYEDKPLKTVEGRQVDVEFVSNVYLVNDHKVIQCNIRDITARKQAEAAHEELQAQLLQAQKLESIGTLAGGVAHEINNPIMGIMNYAQLIVDQLSPDSPATEYATEIGKETQRVATIVKNLLSFARLDKETHKSRARLCDIVEETLSLIRAVMQHDQIALAVNVPDDLPRILCRSQQIRQVTMNLLTNARDTLNQKYPGYDENKKVIISARKIIINDPPSASGMETSDKHWLRLTVEDHGPGITEELRERIFNPFFSTKDRHQGTGLGLSISHGIVTDHGGTLSVESAVGQWTRFHVDLPVAPTEEPRAQTAADGPAGRGRAAPSTSNESEKAENG